MKSRIILLFIIALLCVRVSGQNNLHFAPGVLSKIAGMRINCAGEVAGDIEFGVVGGVPPYSYTLTLNNTFSSRGTITSQGQIVKVSTLTQGRQTVGIVAGTYELVVEDSKGCTLKHRFGISEPEPIRIVSHVTPPSKLTGDDGAIRIVGISGGVPGRPNLPYRINWYSNVGGRLISIPNFQDKMILSGLRAGDYTVKITDFSSPECSNEFSFSLVAPPQLLGSHTIVRPILCNVLNDRSPNRSLSHSGIIRAVASGGVPPYTYKWYDSRGRLLQAGLDPEIRNLGPGIYSVEIEDANNHVYTVSSINLEEPHPISISRSEAVNTPFWDACTTYGTIVFDVNARRYQELKAYPLYYIQNPQANNKGPDVLTNVQPVGNRLTLFQPGEYYIIVEDQNGCRAEGPKTTVNTLDCLSCCNYQGSTGFNEPIQNFITSQKNPCAGGLGSIQVDEVRHVNLNVKRGPNPNRPFQGRYQFEILNLNGTPYRGPSGTTSFRNNTGQFTVEGGKFYIIAVLDSISRTRFFKSFHVPFNSFYFDTLTTAIPVTTEPATCNTQNRGRIKVVQYPVVETSAGIRCDCLDCMYEIRDFNTNRLVFRTTAAGITPINQVSTFPLPRGEYRLCVLPPLTFTGCLAGADTACLRVSQYCYPHRLVISQDPELELKATAEKTTICSPSIYEVPTTQIHVEVKGGMPPYNVSLYENNNLVPPYRTPLVNPVGRDGVYHYSFPVVAGNYAIEVLDENGCAKTTNIRIDNFPIVRLAAQQSGSNCYDWVESGGNILQGGHISILAAGGRPSYLVEVYEHWQNDTRTYPFSMQGERIPTLAGLYTIKVYDSNDIQGERGCVNSNFSRVNVSLNPQLNICHSIIPQSADRVRIELTVSGGTPPYTYEWSNNARTWFVDNVPTGLNYSVTVTDANNCRRRTNFVTSLDELTASGSEKLVVFPNPTQNTLYVYIPDEQLVVAKSIDISILDALGKEVRKERKVNPLGEVPGPAPVISINTTDLTSGMYFIIVNAGGKQWMHHFIRER
ncbi:MAG: T9SS type A sorting domain-containing protein [Bacteroidia bacterium]|nr:T9SS type A sorting domain-containing protein [Bacteroidia bacterium]MDW8158618.1 T9SS type A sorting domain-containing protein [Bacteroidia bacterium]